MEAVGGATVEEHLLADCFEQNVGYEPMNMPGQERIALENIDQCQQRCKQTAKCAHFTWWSDGGCHLQDDKAKKKKQGGLQAGPPACQETTMRHCCFVASQQVLRGSCRARSWHGIDAASKPFRSLQELEIQIGTRALACFISAAQAKRAMEAEVKGRSFAALVTEGRELWRKELQKATAERRLEVFYTSLYRALLFPRRLDEDTPTGGVLGGGRAIGAGRCGAWQLADMYSGLALGMKNVVSLWIKHYYARSKDATNVAPGLTTSNKKLRASQRASLRTERSDAT
ncbi:Putative glycosidase [Durusdinium trenchii]|uniref:Glycosidase n=1 Tax=Durusdinium trenchii TaxID=1381693 RepID=A0ABP0R1B8_9DINO